MVVARIMQHAAMLKAIESLDELVTQRRREQLALSEGRPLPPKKKANQSAKETKSPGDETAMRQVVKVTTAIGAQLSCRLCPGMRRLQMVGAETRPL